MTHSTDVPSAQATRPGMTLRRLVVDSPTSFGARARSRRWEVFSQHFPGIAQMSVLDLGGTVDSWLRAPVRPGRVTVLNLSEPGRTSDDRITPVLGDACEARTSLGDQGHDLDYDLVFSNSVIEHVGGHAKRAQLAVEVRALAPNHWIQTPNRAFPMEPHWLFPGMQFLPTGIRAQVALRWPLTHTRPPNLEVARSEVMWTDLVSRSDLAGYFPQSEILSERVAGIAKSLIAVKVET